MTYKLNKSRIEDRKGKYGSTSNNINHWIMSFKPPFLLGNSRSVWLGATSFGFYFQTSYAEPAISSSGIQSNIGNRITGNDIPSWLFLWSPLLPY